MKTFKRTLMRCSEMFQAKLFYFKDAWLALHGHFLVAPVLQVPWPVVVQLQADLRYVKDVCKQIEITFGLAVNHIAGWAHFGNSFPEIVQSFLMVCVKHTHIPHLSQIFLPAVRGNILPHLSEQLDVELHQGFSNCKNSLKAENT